MLPFSFLILLELLILGFCGQALPLDFTACCLVPLPLFLAVLGMVTTSLSCSILPFPSHLLLVRLPIWGWGIWGDVRQSLLSILNVRSLWHRDLRWVTGHEDLSGVSWGQVCPGLYSCRAVQNLYRTLVIVSWKSIVILKGQELHHAD